MMTLKMEERQAKMVCFIPVLGVLPAMAILVLEKHYQVRKIALQAILLWVTAVIGGTILDISVIGRGFVPLFNIIGMIVLPLALAIRVNGGEDVELPFLGEIAEKLLKGKKVV